jgi:hypothetical protein
MENKTPIQNIIEELRAKVSDNPSNPFYSAFGMAAIICEKHLSKEKSEIIDAVIYGNKEPLMADTRLLGEKYFGDKFK